MTEVLVTGFGSYADQADNPSGTIAMRLNGWESHGIRIHGVVLPVTSRGVGALLSDAIERLQPDVVVITGVAPGRAEVAVERLAANVRDFPIPDVDGFAPIDQAVVDGGPDAYFSTLPIKAILAAWRRLQIPSYVSNSAGTYVCNQTFYLARHFTENRIAVAGLVHIPPASPALDLPMLEEAVRVAAIVAATHRGTDVQLGAGTTT